VSTDVKLKCLELAILQASKEGCSQDLDRVAEITNKFYTLIVGEDPPSKGPGRRKVDKAEALLG
jgi:hypothetical protein